MEKLTSRVAAEGITATWIPTARPAGQRGPDRGERWFSVTLTRAGRSLTIPYGMGPALTGDPEAADVMSLLRMIAAGVNNAADFADWCGDWDCDPQAEESADDYALQKVTTASLRAFLGDTFEAWLYDTVDDL